MVICHPPLIKIKRQSVGIDRKVASAKCGNMSVWTNTSFGSLLTLPKRQGIIKAYKYDKQTIRISIGYVIRAFYTLKLTQSHAAARPMGVCGHEQFCFRVLYR